MRLPQTRPSVPSLITTIIVLGLIMACLVDLRERAQRKWRAKVLPVARAAYRNAIQARDLAEMKAALYLRREDVPDAVLKQVRHELEAARAEEEARRAEYDRVKGGWRGRFW